MELIWLVLSLLAVDVAAYLFAADTRPGLQHATRRPGLHVRRRPALHVARHSAGQPAGQPARGSSPADDQS